MVRGGKGRTGDLFDFDADAVEFGDGIGRGVGDRMLKDLAGGGEVHDFAPRLGLAEIARALDAVAGAGDDFGKLKRGVGASDRGDLEGEEFGGDDGVVAGEELKEIVVGVTVRVGAGGGVCVGRIAEVSELPIVADAVGGVGTKVVGNGIEDGQVGGVREREVVALHGAKGVFIHNIRGGEAGGIDASEWAKKDGPGEVGWAEDEVRRVIHGGRGTKLAGRSFVYLWNSRSDGEGGRVIELAGVAAFILHRGDQVRDATADTVPSGSMGGNLGAYIVHFST